MPRLGSPTVLRSSVLAAGAMLLAGCGAGTAGVAAAILGAGGGGSAAPAVRIRSITHTKTSPALIEFEVINRGSSPLEVEIVFFPATLGVCAPGAPPPCRTGGTPIRLVADDAQHIDATVRLSTDRPNKLWDFAANGIGPSLFCVPLEVRLRGEGSCQDSTIVQLGNDAPVIGDPSIVSTTTEVVGIVHAQFPLRDDTSDFVDVDVDYLTTDVAGAAWQPARPAGSALDNEATTDADRTVDFFWDVLTDLPGTEHDVRLRFTPTDKDERGILLAQGTPREVAFRVDNNLEPVAVIGDAAFTNNTDQRRAIPIPFTVFDAESDRVQLIFQWRRPEQSFDEAPLALPRRLDGSEIARILADPAERRRHQIATEAPLVFEGRVVPADLSTRTEPSLTRVRLPELAARASPLLADGIVSRGRSRRDLEIHRRASALAPVATTWEANPLVRPVVALPIGDGLTALVLDEPATGSWRLREIELATGEIMRTLVAAGAGTPTAMTFGPGAQSVLVATVDAQTEQEWRVERVDLATGGTSAVAAAGGEVEHGTIRGLANLGSHLWLATVSRSLFVIDESREPRVSPLLAPGLPVGDPGLCAPWGIVVDPSTPHRIFLAERDLATPFGIGEVSAIDLDVRYRAPVVSHRAPVGTGRFPSPESMALDPSGARLLVVTRSSGDMQEVRALDIGIAEASGASPVAGPFAGGAAGIATGPDGLRVLALSASNDLAVGGGVEQRRSIVGYEPRTQTVIVDPPFRPAVGAQDRWRIVRTLRPIRGSANGTSGRFLWDTTDVLGGGPIVVRFIAADTDVGTIDETTLPKLLRDPLDARLVSIDTRNSGNSTEPSALAIGDLDGDGDFDLVCANRRSDDVRVFRQGEPGTFVRDPVTFGGLATTRNPQSIALGDLNADGCLDLVTTNQDNDNSALTIFFQDPSTCEFDPNAVSLPCSSPNCGPAGVGLADLNGDGRLDAIAANEVSGDVAIYLQGPGGQFGTPTFRLGSPGTTAGAHFVATGDLNGDGLVDVVSANTAANTVTIFHQMRASRTFDPVPSVILRSALMLGPASLAVADVDRDGRLDVVTANTASNDLTVFYDVECGTCEGTRVGGPGVTDAPVSVTAGDLDGDGDVDLVSANTAIPSLAVFFQTEPRTFVADPSGLVADPLIVNQPGNVVARDIDGDGTLDLVFVNENSNNVAMLFQVNPGEFRSTPTRSVGSALTTKSPQAVALGDLDGDGDLDFVTANSRGNDLAIFTQTAPGIFEIGSADILGGAGITDLPKDVAVADLNGDGLLDVVSANANRNDLTVFFRRADGSYGSAVPLGDDTATLCPKSVAAADLNGDGLLDLVCANDVGMDLRVFFQTATGFTLDDTRLALASPSNASSVKAADVNGDGYTDVVATFATGVAIFYQRPLGEFGPAPDDLLPNTAAGAPLSVEIADLDGDGKSDLVVTGDSNQFDVVLQTSLGTFNGVQRFGCLGLESVAAGDLDGDGDVDLVAACRGANSLQLFVQVRTGFFAPREVLGSDTTTRLPFSVVIADLDGDGDADILCPNSFGDDIALFFGTH